jgi:hypothetical protein
MISGLLAWIHVGAMNVTDEWNCHLPDYEFTKTEEFLSEVWRDRPWGGR